jgi:FkbM family methyltransferase
MPDEGGFYIDVGCNKPIKKSNTFPFYLKRWKGITIDANAELIKEHKRIRKNDISICAAVSNTAKEVVFYKSSTNLVSTISEKFYTRNKYRWKYTQEEKLITRTLTSILDENLPQDTSIDFLSIDVEGVDLEVLQGMDFKKYRPKLIIIELHAFSIGDKEKYPVYQLLTNNDYYLHAFATMNVYFIDSKLS